MQTFSRVQRDSAYKKTLKTTIALLLIVIYGALTDMLPYLPPLLGIAFARFCRLMDREEVHYLLPLAVFLVFFEANKDFLLGSSLVFFFASYHWLMPRVKLFFGCQKCLAPLMVVYTYLGFYLFSFFVGAIFGVQTPSLTLPIFYFIIVESILLVLIHE